jgi:hypothetical protein
MLKIRDLYTQVVSETISSNSVPLGQTIIQYEVRAYTDTRNLTETKSYIVTCTQRLTLPNNTYVPQPQAASSFMNYPALLSNSIAISPDDNIQSMVLLDYSPRTLNTAITSSQNNSSVSNDTVSQQYSAGSSLSQTNSYGVSASLGFFGEAPTGDLSANFETSRTRETSTSLSTGNALDRGSQVSNSNAMSIKDWGSYASINTKNQSPTWVWGQEYPWNVIEFKNTDDNGNIKLPSYVSNRLYDTVYLYPPSELSLFGVDFVAKASWQITPAPDAQALEIEFTHTLIYCAGSHSILNSELTVGLDAYDAISFTPSSLDLAVLALDPILSTDTSAAILGFVVNQFDVPPTSSGSAFAITSQSNKLLARGSGFNGIMTTDFSAGPVRMEIFFKVVDATANVVLSFKHWVVSSATCQLSIVVNGNTDTTLTKFVNSPEAGSGGDNIMVIVLRQNDFTSVDYCDYLQMGLNTISITFSPVNPSITNGYQIIALAVA